jgi:hypothetical protein
VPIAAEVQDRRFLDELVADAEHMMRAPTTQRGEDTRCRAWDEFLKRTDPPPGPVITLADVKAYVTWLSAVKMRVQSPKALVAYAGTAIRVAVAAGTAAPGLAIRDVASFVARGLARLNQSGASATMEQPRLSMDDLLGIAAVVGNGERELGLFAALLVMAATALRCGSVLATTATRAEPWRTLYASDVVIEERTITITTRSSKTNSTGGRDRYTVTGGIGGHEQLDAAAAMAKFRGVRALAVAQGPDAIVRSRALGLDAAFMLSDGATVLSDDAMRTWLARLGQPGGTHAARRGALDRIAIAAGIGGARLAAGHSSNASTLGYLSTAVRATANAELNYTAGPRRTNRRL